MPNTLALIAHSSQHESLIHLVKDYLPVLSRYRLIASESTGQALKNATGLEIELVQAETQGGDIQLAAEVIAGQVAAVLFVTDRTPAPDEPTLQPLERSCQLRNVPLGLNLATCRCILESLSRTKTAHLIFNPVSGHGNAEADLILIRDLLDPYFNLHIQYTSPEVSAEQLAQAAVDEDVDVIIASGGDGTLSAVAGPMIGTKIPLGIIPRGTANAFGAAIGIPLAINPIRSACRTILDGYTKVVDTARCNGLPMILLAGIGFEAEMVEKASRDLKDQWGALAYLMAGWQQLNEQELFDFEAEVDGKVYPSQAGAITIANAAPPTSVLAQGIGQVAYDDGWLDWTIATTSSKLETVSAMLGMFGSALVKAPSHHPSVEHGLVKQIKITAHPPQKVVVDGEVIGTTPVEIECLPQSLTVFVPKP